MVRITPEMKSTRMWFQGRERIIRHTQENLDPEFRAKAAQMYQRLTNHPPKLKVERIWCKYCKKEVEPVLAPYDDLVNCAECNYGLWTLEDFLKEFAGQ